MRVGRLKRPEPCYCTECGAPNALHVRFQNKQVVENASFAVCLRHAESLASMLMNRVLDARRAALTIPLPETPEP